MKPPLTVGMKRKTVISSCKDPCFVDPSIHLNLHPTVCGLCGSIIMTSFFTHNIQQTHLLLSCTRGLCHLNVNKYCTLAKATDAVVFSGEVSLLQWQWLRTVFPVDCLRLGHTGMFTIVSIRVDRYGIGASLMSFPLKMMFSIHFLCLKKWQNKNELTPVMGSKKLCRMSDGGFIFANHIKMKMYVVKSLVHFTVFFTKLQSTWKLV